MASAAVASLRVARASLGLGGMAAEVVVSEVYSGAAKLSGVANDLADGERCLLLFALKRARRMQQAWRSRCATHSCSRLASTKQGAKKAWLASTLARATGVSAR